MLALSEGADWGWASAAFLACIVISIVGCVLFVLVERRVPKVPKAPKPPKAAAPTSRGKR